MRFFSCFLVLISIWQTAIPCCNANSECYEQKVEVVLDLTSEDNCEDHFPCSPFYSCGTCIGFSIEKTAVLLSPKPKGEPNTPIPLWSSPSSEQHKERLIKPPGLLSI